MPNIIARAHRVAGDAISALVLLRLAHWYRVAVEGGREHTAQSYDDLMRETSCTKKQAKRAISVLKEEGLIEVFQGLFSNRNVNHYRLTDRALRSLRGSPEEPLQGLLKQTLGGPFYIQGETTGSDNTEKPEQPLGTVNPGAYPSAGSGEGGQMASAKEILATTKWGKDHKPDSPSELGYAWKNALAEVNGGGLVHLTQKQIGQLKLIRNHVPPGIAAKVIEYAVTNWIEFVKNVETQAGVKSTPSKPSVDFLLKHASIAASLYEKSSNKASQKQEATAGVHSGKSVQLISQKPNEEKPQTLEELMAIWGDDEE